MNKRWDNDCRAVNNTNKRRLGQSLLLLFALTAINNSAHAVIVADELPDYYQIEFIIFSNLDPAVVNAELWPHDIQLQYPEPLVLIHDENHRDNGDSTADRSTNRQTQGFEFSLKEPSNQFAVPDFQLNDSATGSDATNANNSDALMNNSAQAANTDADDTDQLLKVDDTYYRLPTTFTQLKPEQRLLETEAGHLRRSRYKHILVHDAWIQNIPGEERPTNVLITGGDQYDQHYELEGSISFWRERYLHISTNLWLNHFILNVGQEAGEWPLLPALPTSRSRDNTLPAKFDSTLMLGFGNQLQSFLENEYIVDRIVLMQQRRRMRSNELHYLDHPLFGMLILITPVTLEAVATQKPDEETPGSHTQTLNPVTTDVNTLLDQTLPPVRKNSPQ